jgi:predicted acetyltransferase
MKHYVTSTKQQYKIKKWCELGLQHKVHFPSGTGMMENWYAQPEAIRAMAIVFENGIPVGITVVMKRPVETHSSGWVNVGVYIKPFHRRRGLGSDMVRRCQRLLGYRVRGCQQDRTATAFYRSVAC